MSLQLRTEIERDRAGGRVSAEDQQHLRDVCDQGIASGGELGSIAHEILRISTELDELTHEAERYLRSL